MIENQLQILKESLEQKLQILQALSEKSQAQSEMIADETSTLAMIDENMDEKGVLIERLTKLDRGFEALYDDIKNEMIAHKDKYLPAIGELQTLIARITECSVSIEAIEARNKAAMEARFRRERRELHHQRKATNVAYHYYETSRNIKNVEPQFMDKKK